MSRYDYEVSKHISLQDPPFAALIMAAIRKADTPNSLKIRRMWPEIWEEMNARYNAPGGIIEGDLPEDAGEDSAST